MSQFSQTLVMKFGGTSVGTVDAMRRAVEITRRARADWSRLIVVTSALSGVTDLLIRSASRAARGDLTTCHETIQELNRRHHEMIECLVNEEARCHQAQMEVDGLIAEFGHLCQAIHVLGEATPRALDTVAGLGERLSVRILAAAIESSEIHCKVVESTQLILTDDHFQNAAPKFPETTHRTRQVLGPLLDDGLVPVVTGFIGATASGIPTTLGRGGSDYSASILAVALEADQVWIWTDVDGVMTADPRLVPDARTIPILSYREVAEMAHFGAKVLHPKSIQPVIQGGITLRVLNTFNPSGQGTCLVADGLTNGRGAIKAVAAVRGLQLVTLTGTGMLGVPGVAGRIFSAVATTGISVPLIIESTSEQAICFPAPRESVPEIIDTLHRHLSQEFGRGDIDRATASDDVDIITVISPGLRTTPGVAAKIFNALSNEGINVLGISFGASDVSINVIVAAEATRAAMQAVHALIN